MPNRPTFASVTDIPCTCGNLQRQADDPYSPIVFDQQTAEFHIQFGVGGAQGCSVIYHCPFCGGAAPPSRRRLLFAVISPEEEGRLAKLLSPVKTIRGALKRLGKPERDDTGGMRVALDEKDAQPPIKRHHRVLTYERLSEVADVMIIEREQGGVHWHLMGKYIGPSLPDGGPKN